MRARERVLDLETLATRVASWKAEGSAVGLCHGCFDILHFGHVRHFEAARQLCDRLVVTVTPDRFVNKGPNRPVFPEAQRAEAVAALASVDAVAVNLWPSAVETLRRVRPSLFIKGQEYERQADAVNPNFFAEATAAREAGTQVAFTHEDTSSSTSAFRKLLQIP